MAMGGVTPQQNPLRQFPPEARYRRAFQAGLRINLRPQAFRLRKGDIFVDQQHSINFSVNKIRELLGENPDMPCYIETLPRRGYLFKEAVEFDPPVPILGRTPGADHTSIAMLPFVDTSARADYEFFGDGLAEEINALAQSPELKVTARTSAFAFKGRNDDVRTMGETLGVSHVLGGSVRVDGSRVRITTQLINTATGYHKWTEKYDRDITDIFSVQDRIAEIVARTLRARLASNRNSGQSGSDGDPKAMMLGLKGRYYPRKYSDPWIQKAKTCFDSAIARGPIE